MRYFYIFYYTLRYLLQPKKIENLLHLGDLFTELPSFQLATEQAHTHSDLRKLMEEKYFGLYPPLQDLLLLPEGSLGREYARFLQKNSLIPYSIYPIKTPIHGNADYLKERARYLHDIAHVILGKNIEISDEAYLNAFLLAQIASPISALIVAGCILRVAFKEIHNLSDTMENILQGWRKGKECKVFLSIRWEEKWHLSIIKLREYLNLETSP